LFIFVSTFQKSFYLGVTTMPERNPASTPQALRNALNVITRNAPADILTVDFDSITQNARKTVDAVDEANRKRFDPDGEAGWREELSELERRLAGQMTTDDAKLYSDSQEHLHTEAVKVIEGELIYTKDLLQTPGLSRCLNRREGREPLPGDSCDLCKFSRLLEVVTLKLAHVKAKQVASIRACGSLVSDAKVLDAYRPRWEELKKREKAIAQARRSIREHTVLQTPRNQRSGNWIAPGGMELDKIRGTGVHSTV
jgi:hypothetical protein